MIGMGKSKENRPSWFKMFRNQKALIDSVPDAEVGQALKAVFQYFENGEVIEMSPLVFAVFSSVKPYVDESYKDFDDGRKRMSFVRWKGLHPSGTDDEFEDYYRSLSATGDTFR